MSAKPACDLLEVRFNARSLITVLNWLKDVCPEMTLEATSDHKLAGSAMLPGNIGMVEIEANRETARWIKSPGQAFFFALNLSEVVKGSPGGRANDVVLSTRKNSDKAQFRYYDPRGSLFLSSNIKWMDYGDPMNFSVEPIVAMSATFAMTDLLAACSTFTRVGKDNVVFDMEKKPDPANPRGEEVYDTNNILLHSDDNDMTFRFEIKQKESRSQDSAGLKNPEKKKKKPSGWDDSDLDEDSDQEEEEEEEEKDDYIVSASAKRGKKGAVARELNQLTDVSFDIEVFTRVIKEKGFAFRSKFFHDLLRISGVQEVKVQLFQRPGSDAYCMCLTCPVPGFGTVKSYLMAVYTDV